ncbi:MAG: cell division ATPase MinD [Candidatus Diapherotrites archaeon]|nr:cell division ATPase MinD [Candidatus Diapherotrites archaeon]
MARIMVIASGKGGTGKTTLTANLGIALSKLGKKVLLIDADVAMANLSLILGMQSSPITLHDVLLGEAQIRDSIYDGPGGIHLVPSGMSLENYKRLDSERLAGVIKEIEEDYDYILLDAAAGIEKQVISAISASQEMLLVTMPNPPALADAEKTRQIAQRLGAKVTGVIINFVRKEKGEIPQQDIANFLETPVYGSVPDDPEVRRTFSQEKAAPVIARIPNSPAAIEFQRIASRLTGLKVQEDAQKEGFIKKGLLARLFFWWKK